MTTTERPVLTLGVARKFYVSSTGETYVLGNSEPELVVRTSTGATESLASWMEQNSKLER